MANEIENIIIEFAQKYEISIIDAEKLILSYLTDKHRHIK